MEHGLQACEDSGGSELRASTSITLESVGVTAAGICPPFIDGNSVGWALVFLPSFFGTFHKSVRLVCWDGAAIIPLSSSYNMPVKRGTCEELLYDNRYHSEMLTKRSWSPHTLSRRHTSRACRRQPYLVGDTSDEMSMLIGRAQNRTCT